MLKTLKSDGILITESISYCTEQNKQFLSIKQYPFNVNASLNLRLFF